MHGSHQVSRVYESLLTGGISEFVVIVHCFVAKAKFLSSLSSILSMIMPV
jgi:hypothetical protein